jgi:pimeloyl-ACP methyl ester carboxylesterase
MAEILTCEVDHGSVTYRRSRGTGRPIVLVHGNSSSSRTWQHLLDGPFGDRFRCLAPDLPGHGGSASFADLDDYAIPGYAAFLSTFVRAVDAQDAVMVGWSLGGHVVLEAAPALPAAAGFVLFGTPPVASAASLAEGFLPNPAMNIGFSADVSPQEAAAYAASSLAPESTIPTDDLIADILATDPAARAGLAAGVAQGRFADEVAIASSLSRPLALLHGEAEQLVSLDYLRQLELPHLWHGDVQVVPGAGHAVQEEAPDRLADLLTRFVAEL